MSRFDCHFFICTNRRDPDNPKGCCASKGSEEIAVRALQEGAASYVPKNVLAPPHIVMLGSPISPASKMPFRFSSKKTCPATEPPGPSTR